MFEQNILNDICGYFTKLAENWQMKTTVTAIGTSYTYISHGEKMLLGYLYIFMTVDLIVGLISSIKTNTYCAYKFERGILKFLTYTASVFLVMVISGSIDSCFANKIPLHLQDFFMSYMIATEGMSIIRHFHAMGLPVPQILIKIASGAQKKAETEIEKIIGAHEKNTLKETS